MAQVVALLDFEDDRVGVSFPDFPGCTTVGRNAEDAVAKAAQVLAFHIEGLAEDGPLPEPRTLAELRRDSQFKADARDAVVAFVPYAPPARAVRINVTIEETLLERIDRAAEAVGETRSGFLAHAARARIGEEASISPRNKREKHRSVGAGSAQRAARVRR
jgi:predicted RNase H-like HicB family nuclease